MAQSDPIPPSWRAKFRYTSYGTLTAGSVGVVGSEYMFLLNSCYDPDSTGVGHQPYGWDQISPLYRKYIVHNCHVTITATDPSADGLVLCVMVAPTDATFNMAGNSAEAIAEKPMCLTLDVNNTGSQKVKIQQNIDLAELEGLTKAQYLDQTSIYGGAVGANPSKASVLKLAAADITATSSTTIKFRVDLVYDVQLYQRVVQSQS